MSCPIICVKCHRKKPKTKALPRTAAANFARTRKGVREDIHPKYCFRSATEANFARILEYHKCKWTFEERSFVFSGYKTKPFVYIMDFAVEKSKNKPDWLVPGFYEIKGYMTADSRTKLRRLKKNYPEEAAKTIVVIYNKYKKKDIEFCEKYGFKHLFYDELTKEYEGLIPTWE